ncbi:hypothetical protein HF1_10210 [Mycoplasma haemofelis str. Langford 1]|uniref:Uncharacterized protein n=1 Tax=Mycoplasma haemofelis (strain Langford 1) TaxID=941640 RepID=E8ZIQ8_MYCHL|nr:hypothetical protein [Mycoplasma haemofelis]CBY93029.1 hypothetical protein HF1_10210 [Mycoplasma haemofelis str. Langford 1]
MAYQTLKIVTLSGGCAAAGGGVAGGFLISSSKSVEDSHKKKDSSESNDPVKKCVLYIAGVSGNGNSKTVTEISKKVEESEIEKFLEDKKGGGNFASDVKRACEGSNKHFPSENNLNVFVYKETTGEKRWIYSQSLQQDWFNKSEVKQTFNTPTKTVAS